MTGLEGNTRLKHKVDAVIATYVFDTMGRCWIEPIVDDTCLLHLQSNQQA